jgi:hypothetical protein
MAICLVDPDDYTAKLLLPKLRSMKFSRWAAVRLSRARSTSTRVIFQEGRFVLATGLSIMIKVLLGRSRVAKKLSRTSQSLPLGGMKL